MILKSAIAAKQAVNSSAVGAVAATWPYWISDPIWLTTILFGMFFGITFRTGQLYSRDVPFKAIRKDIYISLLIAGANFSLILFLIEILHLSLMGTLLTAVLVAASGLQAIVGAAQWVKEKLIQDQIFKK